MEPNIMDAKVDMTEIEVKECPYYLISRASLAITGAAPVPVSLPVEGQPLYFEKLLSLDEDLWVEFGFKGLKD